MAEPAPDGVRVNGPFAAFADGFLVDLVEQQGYRLWPVATASGVPRVGEPVDGDRGGRRRELTPAAVERFVAERRRAGYRSSVPKSMRPLLAYLGGLGALPAGDGEPLTSLEKLLAEYRDYLLVEHALTPGSVALYEPVARLFLEERSAPIGEDLARLSGREIHAFVLGEVRRRGQRSAETRVFAAGVSPCAGLDRDAVWRRSVPSVRRREGLPRGARRRAGQAVA